VTGGAANPAAGRRFEYKVRDDLKANGYWVMKSPASKSPVDMVAIKPGQVLFVQCKLNGRIDPAEREALYTLAWLAGGMPILAELSRAPGQKRGGVIWYRQVTPGKLFRFELDEVAS
jgi:Holliday junction resolvase